MSWRPGDRLDRAEALFATATTSVPTELRKYCEEVLITLDAYSPTAFFNWRNLRTSLDAYVSLAAPNPLASADQVVIGTFLRDVTVVRVLNAGSHSLTESDVTEPMMRTCFDVLRKLDHHFKLELCRLEAERLRTLKCRLVKPTMALTHFSDPTKSVMIPFDRLHVGDDAAAWEKPVRMKLIGIAAAQTHGCVVDIAAEPWESDLPAGVAVLVAGDALCPIARQGQWVLLGEDGGNGDLVAARDVAGNRYLRRAWSHGDCWLLEAVNPSAGIPPVSVRKSDCKARKVNGVCYDPHRVPVRGKDKLVNEWTPRRDFDANDVATHFGITVSGTSLDPIALDGQVVLVARKVDGRFDAVAPGSLAVVETDDERVGNVIKRVYPGDRTWLLVSPNLIEPRAPIAVVKKQVRAVWPVRGVLFDVTAVERFDVEPAGFE